MTIYPDSYYTRTMSAVDPVTALQEEVSCEVCIVGAGIAGLTLAYELGKRGKSVVLIDGGRIGWGASGRNGGFVFPGWAQGIKAIEQRVGLDHARALFDLSVEGGAIVRENIDEIGIDGVDATPGKLGMQRYHAPESVKRYRDHMQEQYGYEMRFVDQTEIHDLLHTDRYHHGLVDLNGFHFHPLNYCIGLARAARNHGVAIYEETRMRGIDVKGAAKRVECDSGAVLAQHVVYCCGGYGGPEFGKLRRSFVPVSTHVIVTEKLGSAIGRFVNTRLALLDDRRASDYYRIVDEDRILWGGRITTLHQENPDVLASAMRKSMISVYPGLKDARIDAVWTGRMGYANHKMPHIGMISPGIWSCTSFGGHGLNTAPIGARVVAEAICNETDRYRLFAPFGYHWNGGVLGQAAVQSIYLGLQMQDMWRERASWFRTR